MAIIKEIYPGKDGTIRGVKLKTANGFIERPVQLLYPLERECDNQPTTEQPQLNPEAVQFRPKRDAGAAAALRMRQVQEKENEEW